MLTCYYCSNYRIAKTMGLPDKNGVQWKKCLIKGKVNAQTDKCKYFDPADSFYCDNYACGLKVGNCLHRRFVPHKFNGWGKCSKCRQFDRDISEIVNDYILQKTRIIRPRTPGSVRKLKRRKDKPIKRQLKRRKPTPKPRKLKRRRSK